MCASTEPRGPTREPGRRRRRMWLPLPPIDGDGEGRRRAGVEVDGVVRPGFSHAVGAARILVRDAGRVGMAGDGPAGLCAQPRAQGAHGGRPDVPDLDLQVAGADPYAEREREVAERDCATPTRCGCTLKTPPGSGVATGDLVRVETRIGHFVVKAWVTEGIHPGVLACSHHMGRWKTGDGPRQTMATVDLRQDGSDWEIERKRGTGPFRSADPDTARIWWTDVGVHQNMTFPVQPDPISGAHCWHQAVRVEKGRQPATATATSRSIPRSPARLSGSGCS